MSFNVNCVRTELIHVTYDISIKEFRNDTDQLKINPDVAFINFRFNVIKLYFCLRKNRSGVVQLEYESSDIRALLGREVLFRP